MSESRHAKNVTTFAKLIISLDEMGPGYKPEDKDLKLPKLRALLMQAQAAMQAITIATPVYAHAIDAQNNTLNNLNAVLSRVLHFIEQNSININKDSITRAVNKIREITAMKPAPAVTGMDSYSIPNSYHLYDKITESFEQFLNLIASAPEYNPSETEIQVASLYNWLPLLKTLSVSLTMARSALESARTSRNIIFYSTQTGLCDIVKSIKEYVRHNFPADNPQYTQILNTEFHDMPI